MPYVDPPRAHSLILRSPSNLGAPGLRSDRSLQLLLGPPMGATSTEVSGSYLHPSWACPVTTDGRKYLFSWPYSTMLGSYSSSPGFDRRHTGSAASVGEVTRR